MTISHGGWSRRQVLRGLGGAAQIAPFIPLLSREAEAAPAPRRLLVVHTSNGVYAPDWLPQGAEVGWKLPKSTASLEPFRDNMIFFKGLDVFESGSGEAHPCGPAMLTNHAFPDKEKGTSVEQVVAQQIGKSTRFPYVNLHFFKAPDLGPSGKVTIENSGFPHWNAGQALPSEALEGAMARLFGGLAPTDTKPGVPDEAFVQRIARRKSVLDNVGNELRQFQQKLGEDDRMNLERHLTSLRGIEHLLAPPTAAGKACQKPNTTNPAERSGRLRASSDMATALFACDLTRVVALSFAMKASKSHFPEFGAKYAEVNHHDITHGFAGPKSMTQPIDQFYAEQIAYLLGKLRDTPEGGGTMLDNTLVLWANEFGAWVGSQHQKTDFPFVTIGGKWAFKTGRYKSYSHEPHGKLLTSVALAFDAPVKHVGTTKFGMGPLSGLV